MILDPSLSLASQTLPLAPSGREKPIGLGFVLSERRFALGQKPPNQAWGAFAGCCVCWRKRASSNASQWGTLEASFSWLFPRRVPALSRAKFLCGSLLTKPVLAPFTFGLDLVQHSSLPKENGPRGESPSPIGVSKLEARFQADRLSSSQVDRFADRGMACQGKLYSSFCWSG